MPLYKFSHNLLNVLVQIANEMELQRKKSSAGLSVIFNVQANSKVKICDDS
jgi:hypothetical protein